MISLHRFLDTPIAIHAPVAAELLQDIRDRLLRGEQLDGEITVVDSRLLTEAPQRSASYDVIENVAIIPVNGVLEHGDHDYGSYGVGYTAINNKLVEAMNDPNVRGIAMQVGSPGGEVSGLFELAETLYEMRGTKPIWSILDDHAYSAAYAIASSTDRVIVPKTGGVGSIGVITMHLDISKLLEDMGIKVSIIQYGERKSDYSMFKQLSDQAQKRLQGHVDAIGEMFVEMVGRNRDLSLSRVRSTEAGTYMGADGVEAGLADAVMSPQAAFETLIANVS